MPLVWSPIPRLSPPAPALTKVMNAPRWTDEVDDLVDAGNLDGAISLLDSVVSTLSTPASPPGAGLRLATALADLAGLHASRGNTLCADELRARAIVIRSRAEAAPGALEFAPLFPLPSVPNLRVCFIKMPFPFFAQFI
jgi:hypothetical protein